MNTLSLFWTILSLSFVILELGHPGLLFFLSFSCGSCAALIANLFGLSLIAQGSLFFIVTAIALLLMRFGLKKFHRTHYRTNIYALIGKQATVTQEVSHEKPGYVMVDGQPWMARSTAHTIPVGAIVRVRETRGAHLIVEIV
jgi:membrane protein implicated in regulation of membrane protease activity